MESLVWHFSDESDSYRVKVSVEARVPEAQQDTAEVDVKSADESGSGSQVATQQSLEPPRGRIRRGEEVLVHGGSGGVGQIIKISVDVSTFKIARKADPQELIRTCQFIGPLGGVFHLTIVLRDCLFENENFKDAAEAKYWGTLNMDDATREVGNDSLRYTVKGTNPQYLIEKIIRTRIYDALYWKEHCSALTAELVVDRGMDLRFVGGIYGGNIKVTPFLCLILKMLQLQPGKDIIIEFIRQDDFKYIRALGAMYIRLTFPSADVLSFDDELLAFVPKPHYALVLCFPECELVNAVLSPIYEKLAEEGAGVPDNVFFMKQKIGNACGAFALLHSVAQNADKLEIDKDGSFSKWLGKAEQLGVEERSKSLEKCDELASAHEECATSGDTEADPENVVHHFICYTNVGGRLYETDSDRDFPRDCGPTSDDTLLRDAGRVCRKLMKKIDSVSFSAIALVGD